MSVICEEIFDEASHPSEDEIRDYAAKIGIDVDAEPELLPLAAEGLMTALPPGWRPCYDDKSKSYYYYNNLTNKTQWEHPLDDVYRGLVKKARAESQSLSLADPGDDATCARDDILSLDEPLVSLPLPLKPKTLEPISMGAIKKDIKISPLKAKPKLSEFSPSTSPKHVPKFVKQKSEEQPVRKISSNFFKSFDDSRESHFSKHPQLIDKKEFKVSGGGSMFLKSNTKKQNDLSPSPVQSKSDPNPLDGLSQPRSILRERPLIEPSKSMDFQMSLVDRSEKDDEDKKSVRFNLDNTTDIAFTLSDNSSNSDEMINGANSAEEVINVVLKNKNSSNDNAKLSEEDNGSNSNLKLIKPDPADFIKPKLTISRGSDSEEDSVIRSTDKKGMFSAPEIILDSDNSEHSQENERYSETIKRHENRAMKKIEKIKQKIWEEKNSELVKFKDDLQGSHKKELERILIAEKTEQETIIKTELENLRIEMENRTSGTLKEERLKFEESLEKMKNELKESFEKEEKDLKEYYETKKVELEKYYDEKLAEIEKELAERVEKNRDDVIISHNSILDQLRQNHSIIIEELKKEFQSEEDILRKDHQTKVLELKTTVTNGDDSEKHRSKDDERMYEKLRCEKRLLEDKYRCLKDKYLRLKTDVKLSIEKRNRRKEQSTTTATTGSETERSQSNKEKSPSPRKTSEKPPTPKHPRAFHDSLKPKLEFRPSRQLIIQDLDTSTSDRSYQSEDKANKNDSLKDYDSSDNGSNPGRNRKKLFSRLKSSSTSRINNNNNSNNNAKLKKSARPCSPVENLRRQLQKLEDLEDQFPQTPQPDTYHLRYPFSDGQKFEGSSELEFFRHRIHLERDSIKRAKESLRTQKTLFQQRQKELKLKHGSMARHTLQQLCQEEKELTDMEVSLHRTRSLLGEKVIRLRHLEQSLQRATIHGGGGGADQGRQEDATLSDISSHSASSGISSTEFATAEANLGRGLGLVKGEHLQESSEIIQSLENLNSEIREIWDVLRQQQQQSNMATVIPPLVYPDLGWPVLAGAAPPVPVPVPPSIPTLADRLHSYRRHVALAGAQSTVVTHAVQGQGATTTLVERTRNLRHWLRQAAVDPAAVAAAAAAALPDPAAAQASL